MIIKKYSMITNSENYNKLMVQSVQLFLISNSEDCQLIYQFPC